MVSCVDLDGAIHQIRATQRSYRNMITHASSPPYVGDMPPVCSPLKYQRLLRGWSQKDVAEALYQKCAENGYPEVGVNEAMVNRWENGHCKPIPLYRKHLCMLYGLTADQLGLLPGLEVRL
jgi:hypothetical protein